MVEMANGAEVGLTQLRHVSDYDSDADRQTEVSAYEKVSLAASICELTVFGVEVCILVVVKKQKDGCGMSEEKISQ